MPLLQTSSHIPCQGTWFVWVGRIKGIRCFSYASVNSFRIYRSHFGFIYTGSNKKKNKRPFPVKIYAWRCQKAKNNNAKNNQKESVHPRKFHHFSSFIKSFLQLVYSFNLHTYTCFLLSDFIIASQCLKSHLYCVSYSSRKICQHFCSLALLLAYQHGDKIMVFKNYDINIKKPQAHTCRGVTGGNN
jgi:hypothetical protein